MPDSGFRPPVGDFPLITDAPLAYLDNAATTQKPRVVLAAMEHYYRCQNANVHRAAHRLSAEATEAFEQARKTVARFIHAAHSDEIVWTRGATEAINLIAQSFGSQLKSGDEIILTLLEHHANIVPWQMLAARSGVVLKFCPLTPTCELDLNALKALLSPRTKLVALTHVSNALGVVNPIEKIISIAHQAGAKVLIDGAQAIAHRPVDVQALGCDFYVFSAHKAYGPTGIGVLYGRRELLASMPPWQGGGEMISEVSLSGSRFQPPPLRFEAGTPAIAEAIGLATALEYLQTLDRSALLQYETHLLNTLADALSKRKNVRLIGQPTQRCGALSFVINGQHSLDVATSLDKQQIALRSGHHCCMPLMQSLGLSGTVRASVACYTRQEDIDRLLAALDALDRGAVPSRQPSPTADSTTPLSDALRTARGRDARHTLLMKAGAHALSTQTDLRREAYRVEGCSSQTWLKVALKNGKLEIALDSDARIIRGLLRVLLEALQGASPSQLADFDLERHFTELGLSQQLTSSRTSGIKAVMSAIRAQVESA